MNSKFLKSFWDGMNVLWEWMVRILLIIGLLITIWCAYDSYYVYSHTLDTEYLRYKPGVSETIIPEDNPISDDMVAWLTIDNTNIDYPVMQGDDNVKYLNTDVFGNYSLSGSIFLDSRNSCDFSDEYSIIYGHHMEYGVMFGALEDFLDETYLKNHKSGTLIIGKDASKTYELEVFAAMQADASDEEIFGINQENTRQFIKDKAVVYLEEKDERIICLSTCANGKATSRTAIFAYVLNQ